LCGRGRARGDFSDRTPNAARWSCILGAGKQSVGDKGEAREEKYRSLLNGNVVAPYSAVMYPAMGDSGTRTPLMNWGV
jgi:hypothetical protein